ncbi:transglutaminase-like domain-containing protein [Microbulbifer salipaludis]
MSRQSPPDTKTRPRSYLYAAILAATILPSSTVMAASDALVELQAQIDKGHYKTAKLEISAMQQKEPDHPDNSTLAFEAERMRRIEMEFTIPPEQLLTSIRRYIPDATEEDLSRWNTAGLLEYKIINGEQRYFNKAAYNLVHISDEAAARTADYRRFTDRAPLYRLHPHHSAVIEAHTGGEAPLRQRLAITYSLTVDADAVPDGETLRAWIPFPKELPGRQENITLLNSTPAEHQLAPADTPQRTIYFEKTARAGVPTEFSVEYAFDSLSRYFSIDPAKTEPVDGQALSAFLEERTPHIQFTPELRALSQRIVGDETNPYRIAQKLFTHVDQIPWAGAREYSTIRNISQYAAHAGHADCGQQTLLLITLMRMNGIPARWQSGWEFSPESFDTMHDWGEFYLAPYGWMPMDVTHGVLESASDAERWFYLGGLDSYRLIFNTDYSQPFTPAKHHFRSETVDSQRGEVEWRGGNLYFDQWDYKMQWQPVTAENKNLQTAGQ